MNAVIALVGLLIRAMDKNGILLSFFSKGCLIKDRWNGTGDFWCHHTLTVYYLWGFLFLLAIIGFIGLCTLCVHQGIPDFSSGYGRSGACDCGDCIWCCWCVEDCSGGSGAAGCCEGGANCCECGAAANSLEGEAMAICGLIALVLLVVFAIVGLLIGVLVAVAVWQKIVQRHMRILQKRELAREFAVVDLSTLEDGMQPTNTDNMYMSDRIPLAENAEGIDSLPELHLTRGLSEQNSSELAQLGLL